MTRVQTDDELSSQGGHLRLGPELLKIKMRLSPLLQVEQVLTRRLTPMGSGESEPTQFNQNTSYAERSRNLIKEVAVNSTAQWKNAFTRLLAGETDSKESFVESDEDDPNDPGIVLNACSEDMARLWCDPTIRQLLVKQNLRLEEMAGL